MKTLALTVALLSAAPLTADGTETRVRVALALSACQCETPGKNCADQAKDLAEKVAVALKSPVPKRNPTDTDRYSAFLASVRQGKSGVLLVGEGDGPCDCRVSAGYAGLAPGLYRCYLKDGIPMMEAIPSAQPVVYRYPAGVCTTGGCPSR
jgi:hypothetical protein